MLLIPILTNNHENDALIIVLDRSALRSMKNSDPVMFTLDEVVKETEIAIHQPNIMITYEDEESMKHIHSLIEKNDFQAIFKYLTRGVNPELLNNPPARDSITRFYKGEQN